MVSGHFVVGPSVVTEGAPPLRTTWRARGGGSQTHPDAADRRVVRARQPHRRHRARTPRGSSPGVRPRPRGSCPTIPAARGWGPLPPLEPLGRTRPRPCRSRARVSIREVWLPRTTVRPRPSRSRPLGTCASMSAETPAMRRSPRTGRCRPRHQTPRYACQFGSLASTSSVDAWTPCAASSAAVDALSPSSAEHARQPYRTSPSNRSEFDAACVANAPSAPAVAATVARIAPRSPDPRRSSARDASSAAVPAVPRTSPWARA